MSHVPQSDDDEYIQGTVRCIFCAHEWVGVRPVGTENMECPKCGKMLGHEVAS